jgi:hypothetical protein
VSTQTIEELKEVAEALSGALQLASRENDALKRQVEAMAKEFSKHGLCEECAARVLCLHRSVGITCRDSIKQWSLEQAKKGGGA